MHIFVINLAKDRARRESIENQLGDLGVSFEFITGVYGASLSEGERKAHYRPAKAFRRCGRPLTPSEIGCALSHVHVYRQIIDRNLPLALILEDDVIVTHSTVPVLSEIASLVNTRRPEVLLLSPAQSASNGHGERTTTSGHVLAPFASGYFTSSYIVTNWAARALLRELYPVGDVADCWRRLERYRVVDLFVVSPTLIEQDQETFGSSTTADYWSQQPGGSYARMKYKFRRAWGVGTDLFYAPYRRYFRPYAGVRDLDK